MFLNPFFSQEGYIMAHVRGLNVMLTESASGVKGTLLALAINDDGTTEDVAEFELNEGPSDSFELRDAWIVEMLAIAAEQSNNPLPQHWVNLRQEERQHRIQKLEEAVTAVDEWIAGKSDADDVYGLLGTLLGSVKIALSDFKAGRI